MRVFIHAPEEYRVGRVMEVYSDTREEAEKNIKRSDGARSAYYRNIAAAEWGDSTNYELSVDSSIGMEATAEVIMAYLRARK